MNAVATRLRAEIDDRIPDAGGGRIEDRIDAREPDRHGVDENVAVIARIEFRRAAHGRHAETIAVTADAGDDAGDEMACFWMGRLTESQEIETGDRARAHGENIAQNAADACRCALEGFDERRVIVAFHLENARVAVANIDDASILSRTANHPGGFCRELPQMDAGRFVGTVLVPHGRENPELREAWRSADQPENALVFLWLETMGDGKRGVDDGLIGRIRPVDVSFGR